MSVNDIDPEIVTVVQQEFIQALKKAGLVLMPAELTETVYLDAHKQKKLLKQPYITPYQIAKNKLLPGVKTLKTVKDMIADNRIDKDEFFKDPEGKLQIYTRAIKRLRNEN